MKKGDGIAPATPNVIGPNFPSRQQNAELFCQMFMLLFKPWTCIEDLTTEATWAESMDSWAEFELSEEVTSKLPLMLHNCEIMSEGREQQKKEHEERARLRKEQGHKDSEEIKSRTHDEYDGMFRPPPDVHHSVGFVKTMKLPHIKDGDLFAQEALNSLFGTSVFVYLEERKRIPEGIDRTVPPTKEWKANVVSQLEKQQQFPEKYSSSARRDPVPYLIVKYKLNQKQTIAFTIIAGRVMNKKSPQLIMYLGGEGGTGKSKVIKAVTELFQILGRSDKLKKAACTGTAAGNIDGVTLAHTFDQQMSSPEVHKKSRKSRDDDNDDNTVSMQFLNRLTKKIGTKIEMMILDEASMISLGDLSRWDARLKQVVTNSGDKPFAGVHILFASDFLQYAPVIHTALFRTPQKDWKTSKIAGYNLWKSSKTVVILT